MDFICYKRQRRIGQHHIILEEQTSFKEGAQSAKPGPGSQIGAVCSRNRRRGTSIPSIYAQRLPMGPKYNVATGREELGSTISYWRSKRHSKRAKVPNLVQAAKSEPSAPARGGKGHPFLQYMPKGFPWDPNTMLQQAEKN